MHVTHSVLEFALREGVISVCMYIHLSAYTCMSASVSVFKCTGVFFFFFLPSLLMQSFRPAAAGHHNLTLWGSIWGFLAPRWKISARKESQCPPRWTCGRIAAGYHCASRFFQIWNSGIWGVSSNKESSSCQTRHLPLTALPPPQAPGRCDGARRSCD